jgi:hypothetical protein
MWNVSNFHDTFLEYAPDVCYYYDRGCGMKNFIWKVAIDENGKIRTDLAELKNEKIFTGNQFIPVNILGTNAANNYLMQEAEYYKNEYKENINTANLCLDTEFFTVRVVDLQETIRRNMVKYDSFVIQSCVEGECKIRIRSTHDEITLRKGYSCLIPAAIADYDMIPITTHAKVIESYINNNSQSNFRRFISQFLHMTNE